MRAESEVRAARDKLRAAVGEIREVMGADAQAPGPESALAALEWVLGDRPANAEVFEAALDLTDGLLNDLRAVDRSIAERN